MTDTNNGGGDHTASGSVDDLAHELVGLAQLLSIEKGPNYLGRVGFLNRAAGQVTALRAALQPHPSQQAGPSTIKDGDASDAEMGQACRKFNIGTPERLAEVMASRTSQQAGTEGAREIAARAVYASRPARWLYPEERNISWDEAQTECPDRIATIYRDVDAILTALSPKTGEG